MLGRENFVFREKLAGGFGTAHLIEQIDDLALGRILVQVFELLSKEVEKGIGVDLAFSVSRIQAEHGVRQGGISKMPEVNGDRFSFLRGNGGEHE